MYTFVKIYINLIYIKGIDASYNYERYFTYKITDLA